MDFQFPPELASFRDEVRTFIAEQLPPDWRERRSDDESDSSDGTWQQIRSFQSALADRHWLTMAWPREYGGLGASFWQQAIMNEEMAYHGAPGTSLNHGVMWVGPSLLLNGSEAQRAEHVGAIARADTWWCTLYSEPGAGSDLAALQTRAVKDGDDYVINGQKIWTTGAHRADWGWLAARTDPDAAKHKGISMFLLDMRSPGVTVRPLLNMAGRHGFNEVFLEDVRIPSSRLVGEANRGWYLLATSLDFERSGISGFAGARRAVEELIGLAAGRDRARQGRYELADRYLEVEVGSQLSYRIVHMQSNGMIPNHEASAAKLFSSELGQRIAATGMRLLGPAGQLGWDAEPRAPLGGRAAQSYLYSVAATIGGGTSEIQRNIIATRGLGLPRS